MQFYSSPGLICLHEATRHIQSKPGGPSLTSADATLGSCRLIRECDVVGIGAGLNGFIDYTGSLMRFLLGSRTCLGKRSASARLSPH